MKTIFLLRNFYTFGFLFLTFAVAQGDNLNKLDTNYLSRWQNLHDGHYLGNELWANPLQDWEIKDGQLQCGVSGGDRNVYLLTHEMSGEGEQFDMRVMLSPSEQFLSQPSQGYVGFKVGIKGKFQDYRDNAIRGTGLAVGITEQGRLFIGEQEGGVLTINKNKIQLQLSGYLNSQKSWNLTLLALNENKQELARVSRNNIDKIKLLGGVGVTCHAGEYYPRELSEDSPTVKTQRTGRINFGFEDWQISGNAFSTFPDRVYGPIAFSMFTLDDHQLKMTVQTFPLAKQSGETVYLQVQATAKSIWETVAKSQIEPHSRTASFRFSNWDYPDNTLYRIVYPVYDKQGTVTEHFYSGKIPSQTAEKNKLKVASLSCHLDLGFPHQDLVKHVASHNADLILFTGDQYYESNSGYGVQHSPLDKSYLDYLRKWYQFGWAFRDLFSDIPSVFLLDDHDVYHGNIWGESGKQATGKGGADIQDSGGYKMPAPWVNAVQRSMTSHLPDPFDPTPVKQGIGVYYTELNYAGVSFALLEDRKWKSAPRQLLADAKIVNGFSKNLQWDAIKSGDVKNAELLGKRQMAFLEHWSNDWSQDTKMKAVVSQTLFSSVQTRPHADILELKDRGMKPVATGDYPINDVVVQDFDTNGWPQTPRKNALELMRQSFAFHVAGDTHLGVTFQYGIEDWRNGAWAIGSPAISNIWPRRWFPSERPKNYQQGDPKNLGDFHDGFGNPITVKAVANPTLVNVEPVAINERAPGYNVLTFDTLQQTLTVEAWPRWINPRSEPDKQFDGWPIILSQFDNGYPKTGPLVTEVFAPTQQGAVVQLIEKNSNTIVYTLRFVGKSFEVRAFKSGNYWVKVFDHNMNLLEEHLK